uniref:Retrotransposon Copia-like N-terminal domain-containing protein n=1 Tax=Lactuca sativa TaxID=4236 RepID=A0A9R1W218_LACSA|nr:hypothetical protein LSAT_V11C400210300 [Lactuca sativa]
MSTFVSNIKSSKIATAITCKLNRSNFQLWKAQLVPIFKGVQLFGYLDGSIKSPLAKVSTGVDAEARETNNPEYNSWMVQDQAVIGGLLSSITKEILQVNCRLLFTLCFQHNIKVTLYIRTQLSKTWKGDLSAAEYYQKMTTLADTMENISHPMTDDEVIGYILVGLGPGHGDLFTAIIVLSDQLKVTLPKFYSYLTAHEAQATITNSMTEFTSSANSVTRQGSNQPRQNSNNPKNNQRSNYHGAGSNKGRGRGQSRRNGGPRCQVRFILGHSALNCRNRFNHAYQADDYCGGNSVTTSPYNGDQNWYIDTRATDLLDQCLSP